MTAPPDTQPASGMPGAGPERTSATRPAGSGAAAQWSAEPAAPMPLIEAIAVARATASELTGLPVDGIAATASDGSGGWRITVDVIESAARMGENDLIAAYDVHLGSDGGLAGFGRARRYRREDREGGA
jgi:hypothetical protein